MNKMSGFKHQLKAYLGQTFIATLTLLENNQLEFTYQPMWEEQGYALSPHLPLDNSAANDQFRIKVFFQNLFPEGENLEIFLKTFHLSQYNLFAITMTLGLDLPGALQLILTTDTLPDTGSFREIHESEIVERLKHYNAHNLVIWDGKPRLSLAGVHQKINVLLNQDGVLGFGEGSLCSTHILKFDRSPDKNIVLNEFLMMRLAKYVGLNVADVSVRYFDEFNTLLIKRFDRQLRDNRIWRRHMIDGCQALNLMPEYKYERHLGSGRDVKHLREGASLQSLFEFCELCRNPALAKKQCIEWTLFNLIIGNTDAHGKNISFFVSAAGIEPAPIYDLISIRMYPEFSQELAMAIGDQFDSTAIYAYQLADFADTCGIPRDFVTKTLLDLCGKISTALSGLQSYVRNEKEKHFLKELTEQIRAQIAHFETQADLISSMIV